MFRTYLMSYLYAYVRWIWKILIGRFNKVLLYFKNLIIHFEEYLLIKLVKWHITWPFLPQFCTQLATVMKYLTFLSLFQSLFKFGMTIPCTSIEKKKKYVAKISSSIIKSYLQTSSTFIPNVESKTWPYFIRKLS